MFQGSKLKSVKTNAQEYLRLLDTKFKCESCGSKMFLRALKVRRGSFGLIVHGDCSSCGKRLSWFLEKLNERRIKARRV